MRKLVIKTMHIDSTYMYLTVSYCYKRYRYCTLHKAAHDPSNINKDEYIDYIYFHCQDSHCAR